ncbi:MAG: hypothetical protein AAFY76_00745 [Cyanobacteria bacterium J06649_11]
MRATLASAIGRRRRLVALAKLGTVHNFSFNRSESGFGFLMAQHLQRILHSERSFSKYRFKYKQPFLVGSRPAVL